MCGILTDDVSQTQDHNEEQIDVDTPSSAMASTTRKGRMRFSPEQVQILEQRFQKQHYLLPADRKVLALSLRMSERQVKTWFQNKRAQCKRARAYTYPSATTAPISPYHHLPATNNTVHHNTFNCLAFPYHPMQPFPPPSSPLSSFVIPAAAAIEHKPTAAFMVTHNNYCYHYIPSSPIPAASCYKQYRTSCQVTGTD